MIASIPSPSFNSIDIGPLSLNLYGLCIALGVVAAVWLFGRRLEERQVGTRDDASAIGVVAVIAGVIGARLYHVVTDWERFEDNYEAIPRIWEGGLGIPGGLLVGIPVGLWMSKRRGIGLAVTATCAAPAIPLAQAIGRWGNYFNQELYGRPTDLPWALEIDEQHLEPGYALGTTFHPTFLYESLWSLALVAVLLWIDRRWRPVDGQLMVMYIIGYGVGRFWVEGLRIDPADEFAGLRLNQWVALGAVLAGFVVLALWPDSKDDDGDGDESEGDESEFADSSDDEGDGDGDESESADASEDDESGGDDDASEGDGDESEGDESELADSSEDEGDGDDDASEDDTSEGDESEVDESELADASGDEGDGDDDASEREESELADASEGEGDGDESEGDESEVADASDDKGAGDDDASEDHTSEGDESEGDESELADASGDEGDGDDDESEGDESELADTSEDDTSEGDESESVAAADDGTSEHADESDDEDEPAGRSS